MELDLYCSPSSLSLYHSVYYIGSILGVTSGSLLYERVGRRRVAAGGAVIITIATFCSTFATSFTSLIVLRILQGLGDQLGYMGAYIWLFEMTPIQYRPFYNSWIAVMWVVGYPTLVSISYFIHNWREICVVVSLVQGFCQLPLLFCSDSPRYLISVGKSDQAVSTLKRWAKLAKVDINLEGVKLTDGADESEREALKEKMPLQKQLLEFKTYPGMLLETGCICWAFMVSSLLFYGLVYGWDRFGDSLYVTYLYVGLGELIANVSVMLVLKVVGRKVALVSFYVGGKFWGAACGLIIHLLLKCTNVYSSTPNGRVSKPFLINFKLNPVSASLCFFLGTINKSFSPHWNMERIMSMFASFFAASSFCLLFLLAGEVSPTTHRGMISCTGSLFARVSAFFGPLLSSADLTSTQRLSLFGVLAASCALTSLVLPETRGRPIPETARDVRQRRDDQKVILKLRNRLSSC